MMPRQGTVVADRYRLERKVGGGKVSAMWRVQDQVTDSTCAIKLLHRSMNDHPEALARFSLEDRLSRELTGDYFPERVGSGSWHSLRYIAWRWCEGECLRSLFERNPKQDVQTVYSIVQETCQALALVHAAGYSHGDLKPENLFFADRPGDSSRQLKLLGFGVASRIARPLLGSQARRTPGQIVGTPLYLSPDIILGRVPRGGQADLWALAVIVYEALTGRAPFLGMDLSEVLQAILERRAARPSTIANLPATFDVWWTQALEQQFATPSDFSTSLARALAPALRSSRTQRSASLPDRISPVGQGLVWRTEASTPRAGEATPGKTRAPTLTGGASASTATSPSSPAQRAPSRPPAASKAAASKPAAGKQRTGELNGSAEALQGAEPAVPTDASGGQAASGQAASGAAKTRSSPGVVAAASPADLPAAALPSAAWPSALAPAAPSPSPAGPAVGASANVSEPVAAPSAAVLSDTAVSPGADPAPAASPDAAAAAPAGFSPATAPAPAASAGSAADAASPLASDAAAPGRAPALPASTTAAGLGSSPLAGNGPGAARVASTAAGLGGAPSAPAVAAAAAGQAASNAFAREERRPEPTPPRPQSRPAQRGIEASAAAAEPQRPNITSTTVAGIGPAALSLMLNKNGASAIAPSPAPAPDPAPMDAGGELAAPAPGGDFGLLPPALRDLGVGTRKTLVGIIPPSALPPAPAPAANPAAAPAAVAASPAAASPGQSLVIAGTPCRSIEVSADDEAVDSVVPLRRLGHSTVPFPRPRAAARGARLEDIRDDELLAQEVAQEDRDGPRSWRNRTSNTLRVVLTDPDHRPHLVAGLLVCSAAALVIFALGRSPVSGTGMLGQTTGSLSGRDGASPAATEAPGSRSVPPGSAPEVSGTAASAGEPPGSQSPGSQPISSQPTSSTAAPGSALPGEELAPGLVVPPRPAPPPADAVKPSSPSPAPLPAGHGSQSGPAPSPPPAPRASSSALASPPPSASAPPAPRPAPASEPPAPRAVPQRKPGDSAPPRPVNPDFDFGI